MNPETLRKIFQSSFDYKTYSQEIVHRVFGCNDVALRPELLDTNAEGDKSHFIGQMEDIDGRLLGFFYTRVADGGDVRRKRVGLRKLISPYLKYDVDGAIAIFDDGHHWRLSYICDLKEGNTSAKRFSYIMGDEKGQYKTPLERLERVAEMKGRYKLSDLREAFSVDALSKEFFNEYHDHYDIIVDELKRQGFEGATIHDYVKKMMGRIVFLHFLQKKGWLNNNPAFLRDLFFFSPHQGDFLEQVLEPLFFGIFNTEKGNRQQLFKDKKWDIALLEDWKELPYLNGGLFERDSIDELNITLPASLFEDLFNFMASYNFTVDENDPDDAEIGVDPEMLGKIFESLLEDNKAKGAFYTPKEIVRYMCKESLIAYLSSQIGKSQSERKEQKDDSDSSLCKLAGHTTDGSGCDKFIRAFVESHEMQPELEPYRDALKSALREVKICDPAIGSGAFPMGLLNELWRCREAVEETPSRVDLKKEIIENNIYGVDIEKGAIDIARLRFWLSIVVDAESPEPLPNFDYKFMQGNSLIESFGGFDLSHISDRLRGGQPTSRQLVIGLDSHLSRQNLQRFLREYFSVTDHQQKRGMRHAINEEVKTLIRESIGGSTASIAKLERMDCSANQDFFLWHTWFKDIFDNGGFDIVIGNPPYLESRSPEFSDDTKNALQHEVAQNRHEDSKFFPRGADLLIYFYELSLRILSKNGISVLITENAWLSTDYGKLFQEFLLKKCEIPGIIDSDYKYFETADINTVITFIKNKKKDSIVPIRFYHSHGNIKDYPCNTLSDKETKNVTIKQFNSNDEFVASYKWGVITKSDSHLIQIMESLFDYEDKRLSRKISIGQGLNITKNNIVYEKNDNTVPYYTSDMGSTYVWSSSNCYVHKNVASSSRKKPLLILPRGLGTHFCSINHCGGFSSSYVEIYGNVTEKELLNIWLFCNSSLLWLLREVTGRTNLGGGMLKAEATDLRSIPICYDFKSDDKVLNIYNCLKEKEIGSDLAQTLGDITHKEIDKIIFDFLGLNEDKDYIVNCLLESVNRRMKKSKNK